MNANGIYYYLIDLKQVLFLRCWRCSKGGVASVKYDVALKRYSVRSRLILLVCERNFNMTSSVFYVNSGRIIKPRVFHAVELLVSQYCSAYCCEYSFDWFDSKDLKLKNASKERTSNKNSIICHLTLTMVLKSLNMLYVQVFAFFHRETTRIHYQSNASVIHEQ